MLSTAFCYARYAKRIDGLTRLGMKNSLTLPGLAKKCFKILRDENVEPISTYVDDYMRCFVRQSIQGGRCGSFNQFYKSIISDEVLNVFSKELDIFW